MRSSAEQHRYPIEVKVATYLLDDMDPNTPKAPKGKQIVLDDEFDNGPHFRITPAGKKLVDDTIADMLNLIK